MMEPKEQMKTIRGLDITDFETRCGAPLEALDIEILQINVGRRCNLACKHCHVGASETRTEMMDRPVFEKCLSILEQNRIGTVDVTGGAPELNPHLEWFLDRVAPLVPRLIARSNVHILADPDYRHFIDVYRRNRIEIVTSLPDVGRNKVERQRGDNTYDRIIDMIRLLNEEGYGQPDTGLVLHLVHNPVGAYLPASQKALEQTYKQRLSREHGITFNNLFCLTNAPIGRYLEWLIRSDNFEDYMMELHNAFNLASVGNIMCKTTLSVGWDGTLYDCDFNQMLDLPVNHDAPSHIDAFDIQKLENRIIVTGNHCYACTAGQGSSCQGAVE